MITYGELITHGFVSPEQQERLRRYLEAKKCFIDFFAPDAMEPDASGLELLRRAEETADSLCHQLRDRGAFFQAEVLPCVKVLLNREANRVRDLEQQIREFSEFVPPRAAGLPLEELRRRLEAAFTRCHSIRSFLFELRRQLSSD